MQRLQETDVSKCRRKTRHQFQKPDGVAVMSGIQLNLPAIKLLI